MDFDRFCMSSYLTFRYVAVRDASWCSGVTPDLPDASDQAWIGVRDSEEILTALKALMERFCRNRNTGILLSGGIDSAILAALMPPGSHAYTVRFVADGSVDETERAGEYARRYGLVHHVLDVTWDDHLKSIDALMTLKRSPLHPVEVGLFKAASIAAADGVRSLVVGNVADSTFGGMDKLLSKDWTFDEFISRYTFVDPVQVLKDPISMREVYSKYRIGNGVDVPRFLKTMHGLGLVQAFDNAIGSAGCQIVAPYKALYMSTPLDINRVRSGDSKYLLREVFKELYPDLEIPEKIAFARPMDRWMSRWKGPSRPEFLDDLNIRDFNGEQIWLIYCLERFMNLFDKGRAKKRTLVLAGADRK